MVDDAAMPPGETYDFRAATSMRHEADIDAAAIIKITVAELDADHAFISRPATEPPSRYYYANFAGYDFDTISRFLLCACAVDEFRHALHFISRESRSWPAASYHVSAAEISMLGAARCGDCPADELLFAG